MDTDAEDELYRKYRPIEVDGSIDPEEKAKLMTALTTRFARTVKISYHLDKTILGGAVVRAGDVVIDGSFAGQLKQLTETLIA